MLASTSFQGRRHLIQAKSAAQQTAAATALSAKRGDTTGSQLRGGARQMEESMTQTQLEEFADSKRKRTPEHVDD